MHRLLVIDDDHSLLYALQKSLRTQELEVLIAASHEAGVAQFQEQKPHIVLLDLRLNDQSGLKTLKAIRAISPFVPIIIFTAYATTASTIEAISLGAIDYLMKPVNFTLLKDKINHLINQTMEHEVPLKGNIQDHEELNLVGYSESMRMIYQQIGRYAADGSTVLITGESGTGKEIVAKLIHRYSQRKNGPFVAINCAAIPESLLESELFGFEKGAFSGAERRRIGKFEYANGGTLFLDEVGDMPTLLQAKLLRLIQEKKIERLGGNESINLDVRIIAATNRNLESLVHQRIFREDLYYRINVLSLVLPPLRERRDDIIPIARHFLAKYTKESCLTLSQEVMDQLNAYHWPGNVRELQSVIRYITAQNPRSHVKAEHLPLIFQEQQHNQHKSDLTVLIDKLLTTGQNGIYDTIIDSVDSLLIPMVLKHTGGNLQKACDILGISRNTLKSKMRHLSLSIQHKLHITEEIQASPQ